MTRISSAQRNLNSFLDQIVNAKSDAAASAESASGGGAAFDSHLAQFSPDANAGSNAGTNAGSNSKALGQDAFASAQDAGGSASRQKNPSSSLSSLLAGVTGDEQTATTTVQQTVAAQTNVTATASDLFAALVGKGQSFVKGGSDANASSSAQESSASSQDGEPSSGGQEPLSALLSLAKLSAWATSDATSTNDASTSNVEKAIVKTAAGKSGAMGASQKSSTTPLPNLKRVGNTASSVASDNGATADLSASAQVTVAMVAASLTSQNAAPLPASSPVLRKDSGASNTQASTGAPRGERANGLAANDTQSQLDMVQPVSDNSMLNPFADLAGSDDSHSQSIKMAVSSIEAQTHFAPVQQLSPTQQIFDFVALTGGVPSLGDSSTSAAAAATAASGSSASDTGSSVTASLAASPVKTLTLALEPDELGTVTIKMRLVNSGLEMQVEAERSSTTSLIEKDKGNLSNKLESLGYSVDSLVVTTVAAGQGTQSDSANNQPAAGQGQPAANDASASGSSPNGGRNANDQSSAQSGGQTGSGFNQDGTRDAPSPRNTGDGVYL